MKLIVPDLRRKEQNSTCTVTMNDDHNLEWECVLSARGECRLSLEYNLEWMKGKCVEFKEE